MVPAVLLAAQGAHAQASSAEAAPAPASATGLAEVVVTARKRSEDLQTTPVSATSLSSAALSAASVTGFQDLKGMVPDLQVTPMANGGVDLAIRGIGQTSAQVNVDAKTGLYIDDMYIARSEGNSLGFFDLANGGFQLFEGPQGTLFGKNTTGGAIAVQTALPSNGPSYVQIRAGNYSRLDAEGGINLPINDKLLTRFSFRTENADGYITHALDSGTSDNVDDKEFRFQVRALPTDKLTIDFLAEHDQNNTGGLVSVMTGCTGGGSYIPNYNLLHATPYCSQYPVLGNRYEVYGGAALTVPTSAAQTSVATGGDYNAGGLTRHGHRGPFDDDNIDSLLLHLTYDLTPDITVKSITASRHSTSSYYNPIVDAPNDIYAEYDSTPTQQYSEELNLTGRAFDRRLNYVLGYFYYDQDTSFLQDTGPDWVDPTGYTYSATNHEKSNAVYGQASFDITSQLQVTAGARYTVDWKGAQSSVAFQRISTGICKGFVAAFEAGAAACNGAPYTGADTHTWSNFNPMGSILYKITPHINAYVTVASGYNAGGFNQQLTGVLPAPYTGKLISYAPEELVDYEGGFKTQWWDNRLRVNIDGFHMKYDDIQATVNLTINGIITRQVQTGASAHEDGVETQIDFAPTRDLNFHASYSYLSQAYDSISPGVTTLSLKTQLPGAPNWQYYLAANYTLHPFGQSLVTVSLNWKANGATPACPTGTPQLYVCSIPPLGLLGGQVNFQLDPDSPWTIGLWGTNLNNQYWLLNKSGNNNYGINYVTPGAPREYGVTIRRTF